jgi:hypothetical protein
MPMYAPDWLRAFIELIVEHEEGGWSPDRSWMR